MAEAVAEEEAAAAIFRILDGKKRKDGMKRVGGQKLTWADYGFQFFPFGRRRVDYTCDSVAADAEVTSDRESGARANLISPKPATEYSMIIG